MAAATAEYSPKIQKRTLKGHRKPVLCLAHSSERLAYYPNPGGNSTSSSSSSQQQTHHHPSLLLSGSEDGTARLWDLRTRRTSLCMVIPRNENDDENGNNEVTSVAFHPSIAEERQQTHNVTHNDGGGECNDGLLPLHHHDCTVYASTANNIYGYDLRHHSSTTASTSPIIKTPHFDLSPLFQCSDEINQLSFSFPKRNDGSSGKYFLSAADDSGEAHVAECVPHRYEQQQSPPNTTTAKNHKTFYHAEPETMAITSSAIFQPRTNNDSYLATGGTDCTIKLWDVAKPRRHPAATIQIKPAVSENTTQLCNPPYVHSLSWSPSGHLLAAGIGDGSCAILRAQGRRLVEIGRLGKDDGGHGSAVAAVCFAGFGLCDQLSSKVRKSGEAEDRLMISAGNDGNVIFWDLGGDIVGSGPVDPVVYLGRYLSPPLSDATQEEGTATRVHGNTNGRDGVKDATTTAHAMMDSLDITSQNGKNSKNKNKCKGGKAHSSGKNDDFPEDSIMPSPPKILFQIAHRQKPNWITCSRASDAILPTSLFVADTTNTISVYTLPL